MSPLHRRRVRLAHIGSAGRSGQTGSRGLRTLGVQATRRLAQTSLSGFAGGPPLLLSGRKDHAVVGFGKRSGRSVGDHSAGTQADYPIFELDRNWIANSTLVETDEHGDHALARCWGFSECGTGTRVSLRSGTASVGGRRRRGRSFQRMTEAAAAPFKNLSARSMGQGTRVAQRGVTEAPVGQQRIEPELRGKKFDHRTDLCRHQPPRRINGMDR
jgi:hypothetical protein